MIELHNIDCMEYLKTLEDDAFELAIVDPPYGIGRDGQSETFTKNRKHKRKFHAHKQWDNETPKQEYFDELKRVSKNQIIWGGNYFVEFLNKGTMGWVFWYKGQEGLSMSDGELAYSSFNKATRQININRGFISKNGGSIHPTQKPVKLYEWLLMNYAKEGDKILDTHLGSGSIAVAAHNLGFELVGCEIDTEYYNAACKRLKQHQAQLTMELT
jgi:site-specific DNA-methyltransferase (adenine-specific)